MILSQKCHHDLKLNLTLINSIRKFKNVSNRYDQNYIYEILDLLRISNIYIKEENSTSIITQNIDTEIYLAIHFALANCINLTSFIEILKPNFELHELNLKDINETNLFNYYIFYAMLKECCNNFNQLTNHYQDIDELDKLIIRVIINNDSKNYTSNKEIIYISTDMVKNYISSRGQYSPYFISYIASQINHIYNLKLHYYIFNGPFSESFTESFSNHGLCVIDEFKNIKFDQNNFNELIKIFNNAKESIILKKYLENLQSLLSHSLYFHDKDNLDLLERFFIGLLGHEFEDIREIAILYLNAIYDGTDWQLMEVYQPIINKVGDNFNIEYLIELDINENEELVLLLNSYPFDAYASQCESIITFHKPNIIPFSEYIMNIDDNFDILDEVILSKYDGKFDDKLNLINLMIGKKLVLNDKSDKFNNIQINEKCHIISMNFNKFPRSGFYDWKFIKLQKDGKIHNLVTNIENDFKIFMNDTNEKLNKFESAQKILQGRFIIQAENIHEMQIHEIYLNSMMKDSLNDSKQCVFENFCKQIIKYNQIGINTLYLLGVLDHDQCPLKVTDRLNISSILGGPNEFKTLINIASKHKIEIIIDWISRISSHNSHQKYQSLFLHYIDNTTQKKLCYGCDGRGWIYEDTIHLNYRKKETWDLLINEAVSFVKEFNVNGFYLDSGYSWPDMFKANLEELFKKSPNRSNIYSEEEIFYGEIINPNELSGYWNTKTQDKLPNPLYIKLIKTLWQNFPNFKIISEVWGQFYHHRGVSIARSGGIPRLFKVSQALSMINGSEINHDGCLIPCQKQSVNIFRSWYEELKNSYPLGAIWIESLSYNPWPYPSLIFKRGTWSAIDTIFFLSSIPMTFMDEIEGKVFRDSTMQYFQKTMQFNNQGISGKELKMRTLFEPLNHITQPIGSIKICYSLSEKQTAEEIINMEKILMNAIGLEYGFDIKKINYHYEHRRMIRNKYDVLKYGSFISLFAENEFGIDNYVLSYARALKKEIAIIATNFREFQSFFYLDLKNLKFVFKKNDIIKSSELILIHLKDILNNENDHYFTLEEFLNERIEITLNPHSSILWIATIINDNQTLYKKALECSIQRIKDKISKNRIIDGNQITNLVIKIIKSMNRVQDFVNSIWNIIRYFLNPDIHFSRFINSIQELKDNSVVSAKLFTFLHKIYDISQNDKKFLYQQSFMQFNGDHKQQENQYNNQIVDNENNDMLMQKSIIDKIKFIIHDINDILNNNKLGAIGIITPELGRWSTVGGLGVMIDEFSIGLIELGEEVICISPYYEKNRKGETKYLEKDSANIKYWRNLNITLGDGTYQIGIFRGNIQGVQLYFLQNSIFFPEPYPDGNAKFLMHQMAIMAKTSLEIFIIENKIPSILITNDWFTGLVPAYGKSPCYNQVFKNSKFLHIIHNLEPGYEGILHQNPDEGYLESVHQLPISLFIDPNTNKLINVSYCALKCCDQWGTVSLSYRNDLLKNSSLASILNSHPRPFAFPNGIPKVTRLCKLIQTCENDHLKAKEMLQKIYFKLPKLDDSIALIAFVGRITQQKGVHLIIEAAEYLISKYSEKIQILVGGLAHQKDPYGIYCTQIMNKLNTKYPHNFWSNPAEFFTNGTLVNAGADFGLMPSLFEPGGIVQHEFFSGSTPVIAFRTGGLKDTVNEFNPQLNKGNGFDFQEYTINDFIYCIDRAMNIFMNHKDKYKILRNNAFESAIDVADVSRAWNKEFYRLFNKIFIDNQYLEKYKRDIDSYYNDEEIETIIPIKQIINTHNIQSRYLTNDNDKNNYKILNGIYIDHIFTYKTFEFPKPKNVCILGSFDSWKKNYHMIYDNILDIWNIKLRLKPGEYTYKFIVDDKWIYSEDDPKVNDIDGNMNNYIKIIIE